MDFETVKAWLTRWTNGQMRNCRLAGILGLTLGPPALAGALAFIYWLLRLFTYNESGPDKRSMCLWITVAALPCMFIGNRFTPRRDLMEERMSEGPATSFSGHYVARGEVLLQVFLWIMFTGPRLFDWALRSLRKIGHWKQFDTHSCAAVLWLLMNRPRKVPFEEIQTELPWLDLPSAIPQVRRIPGVLQLQAAPIGLSLTQDLRDTIRSGCLT